MEARQTHGFVTFLVSGGAGWHLRRTGRKGLQCLVEIRRAWQGRCPCPGLMEPGAFPRAMVCPRRRAAAHSRAINAKAESWNNLPRPRQLLASTQELMCFLPVDWQHSIHCWGFLMGSSSALLPAFQTSSGLLFAEKDKWLWRECTFVRIFIILLCVFREPAGKVEEFMERCFQEDICQVVAPHSVSAWRRGRGSRQRPRSHPFCTSHFRSRWV